MSDELIFQGRCSRGDYQAGQAQPVGQRHVLSPVGNTSAPITIPTSFSGPLDRRARVYLCNLPRSMCPTRIGENAIRAEVFWTEERKHHCEGSTSESPGTGVMTSGLPKGCGILPR